MAPKTDVEGSPGAPATRTNTSKPHTDASDSGPSRPELTSDNLVPDPKSLKFPPRPPSAGELPPPLDFLPPSKFQGVFPVSTNRIANFPPAQIAQDALSTRVILHPRMPALLSGFLTHKRAHGSTHEQRLYATLTWPQLASRLIIHRPLSFLGRDDLTRLRDGRWLGPARAEWDRVGTAAQHLNRHLTLDAYLSYDEIVLAALLGASAPTHFLNSGDRHNAGVPAYRGVPHEPRGVMAGLVGPRFDRDALHDTAVICKRRPGARGKGVVGASMDPAVRRLFRRWLLPGVEEDDDEDAPPERYAFGDFDIWMYKARLRVSFDLLLLEAEARAREAGREAVVHVVGLGLGVWRKYRAQNKWYVEAFADALRALALEHIAVVEFGWIGDVPEETKREVEEAGVGNGIDVRFTQADPCRKLVGKDEGRLLVVSWAWDGNSYVGNEYWNGQLDSSSDPAAVCYSTIGELMNPDINPFADRVMVVGLDN